MDDIEFDFEDTAPIEDRQLQPGKDKMKRIVCRHFLKNECQRGNECSYLHTRDIDKMPDCDLGMNCNRPNCILKHPPQLKDKECLFYKQGFCPYGKRCQYMHVVYDDGNLPVSIDISARIHENEIGMKDRTIYNSGIRRNKCNSYEEKGTCVYGENCIYCHELLDMRVASIDRRTPREMNMPDFVHDSYSYFYFCFPHITTLSEYVLKNILVIPSKHIDKVNEAFDKPRNHVYFFISALNSKLLHAMCEMKERCTKDRDLSHSFSVDWIKIVHMPFMIFDRSERTVKLDTLEDGEELTVTDGGELFEWVWRHPNTLLMMRQSMLTKPKTVVIADNIVTDDNIDLNLSSDLIESTSFIHGDSLIIRISRRSYEDAIDNELLRLPQSLSHLTDRINIGSFILICDGDSLYGLLQATSTPKHFIGKAVSGNTLSIEVGVRLWHRFRSISLRKLSFVNVVGSERWVSKRLMTAIMGEFLRDSGAIAYPNRMNIKSEYSKDINIDISDKEFAAGRKLREHPTFLRFSQTNGWCYLELIGEGSYTDDATLVKNNTGPLHLFFYCSDGLRFRIVKNQILAMAKEIYMEYQEVFKAKGE